MSDPEDRDETYFADDDYEEPEMDDYVPLCTCDQCMGFLAPPDDE